MEKSNVRKRVLQLLVCIGLVVLIWGGYFFVKKYKVDRILEVREDDFSWVYQVDSIETKEKELILQGFAFELETDAKVGNYEIVLQDIESNKNYFSKMRYSKREDVNRYFLCEYDYSESGFVATIKESKLNIEGNTYEVLLRIKGEREAYQTGVYISNGELVYKNPLEFKAPEVAGTDLEEVVENGVLSVYRPDHGMYVYQCDKEIYFIAEPEYDFVDGNARLQCQFFTTQSDALPKAKGKKSSDESFWFKDKEILDWNVGKYRVARHALPTEYSITRIQVGKWENEIGWVWREQVCPNYTWLIEESR